MCDHGFIGACSACDGCGQIPDDGCWPEDWPHQALADAAYRDEKQEG